MVVSIVSILIGFTVLCQLYFFVKALRRIRLFKKLVPTTGGLKAVKVFLPQGNELSAEQILAHKEKHMLDPEQRIPENQFFEHIAKSSGKP